MKKLRVGIIGAGGIVKTRHLPGLQKRFEVEVRAVSNASLESAEKVAKEFNIPDVHKNWADLMAREDLDIIWIGTPPYMHAPLTISALEAGKHVFCQARMAMNLREARDMLAASQARPDLVTMLCPPPHGMKHGAYFRKLLNEGYTGDPLHFRLQALGNVWTDPGRPIHFRQSVELSGNNILSVGIYMEMLNAWLGLPKRLHAQMKVAVSKQGGIPVHVPDIVQVIGQWSNGLVGTLEWSGVSAHPPEERLEIYGRDGTLVYRFGTDEILGARRGEKELHPLPVPPEFVQEWRVEDNFIDAVLHGGSPEPSFETGVRYMEVIEALHQSARGGHAVELPLS